MAIFSFFSLISILLGLFGMGMVFYALYLAIKALKIYIKKNS